MIRTIIVDDEELAVEQLFFLLKQYDQIDVVAQFTDPLDVLGKVEMLKPELIFLDIKMPGISGLDIADEIMQISPKTYIVFVTAFDEYALKAFDYNAIDYIIKPVTKRRLNNTMEKYFNNRSDTREHHLLDSIPKIRQAIDYGFHNIIAAEEDCGRILLLNPADVLMFTPRGHGAVVYTSNKKYSTKQSMNYWENRLAAFNFFRCHKSYLVNFNHIEKIIPMFNNTYVLKMTNFSTEIPVSRNKAKELNRMLGL